MEDGSPCPHERPGDASAAGPRTALWAAAFESALCVVRTKIYKDPEQACGNFCSSESDLRPGEPELRLAFCLFAFYFVSNFLFFLLFYKNIGL